MKLLLDQGLPRTAARLLSEAGIETIHVGDVGYATADDADIIEFARPGGFVIVTLDADFHALLALSFVFHLVARQLSRPVFLF